MGDRENVAWLNGLMADETEKHKTERRKKKHKKQSIFSFLLSTKKRVQH